MSSGLNIGVVGAGYWGKNLVRNFARVKGGRLVHVSDLEQANRDRTASLQPEATVSASYQELLADERVLAVAVATGAATHHEVALAALRAGKHVYVEKPLCLREDHARELVDEARGRGLRLMVGHLLIHHPAVRWMKEHLDGGELGDLRYLYSQRLNLGLVRTDESAWWSLAPHDISVVLHLVGERPLSIAAHGACYLQEGVEDVVFANLEFPSGRLAQIHTSWLDPHKIRKLTMVCDGKMVTFDDMEQREKLRVYDKGIDRSADYATYGELLTMRQGDIWIPALRMSEPLLLECQEFVDAVQQDREALTPGTDGLDVVSILAAGDRSMRAGGALVKLGD